MNFRYFFAKAKQKKWAIGQFNISTLEILEGIIQAAKKDKSPVIIGTSERESKFIGLKQAVYLIKIFREQTRIPMILHLDHGKDLRYITSAIDAGYDSVHFDGSSLSLKENIEKTRRIVSYAKRRNVFTEGEVGIIGSAQKTKERLTDPEEAWKFVRATNVDNLAVSIGNIHGINNIVFRGGKISKLGINPNLNLDRLKKIKSKIGSVGLVLHGGSGTPDNDVKKAVSLGVIKVNINTEIRVAYTSALKESLKTQEIIPYKYLPKSIEAVEKIVRKKILLIGSKNKC